MRYEELKFDISTDVLALGLRGAYFAMGGIQNKKSDPEFEQLKDQVTREVLAEFSPESIQADPILQGFWHLHEATGRSSKKHISSPENLLNFLLETGQIPHINLLVDIYNLVSIKTRLALGAHDLATVSGNIHLRLTNGTEGFWPLGASKPKPVGSGEYSYVDDDNDIICRLEVRQVEKTKITLDTTECFYIVQGNSATDEEYIRAATEDLIALTRRFCGGKERMLYAAWEKAF